MLERKKSVVPIIALVSLLGCIQVEAQTYPFKFGDKVVQVPAPLGLVLGRGLNPAFDQFLENSIGSNKLLTYFTDQKGRSLLLAQAFPSSDSVMCSAQSYPKIENVMVSEREFDDFRSKFRVKLMSGILSPEAFKDLQNHVNKATKEMAGATAKLELGKPVNLGLFEDLPNSLVFGTIETVAVASQNGSARQTITTCTIGSINRVSDRILFQYCTVPYRSPEDINYALSIFRPWRDQTLNLNSNSSYPWHEIIASAVNSGVFKGVPEAGIKGAIIGVMIALPSALFGILVWLWRRRGGRR
jgi:hypothetical protein